jgi:hypothetical protein
MVTERNVDQLRHDIDSGKTGEKVDYPDPAAAPLGTDAEAGGHPPQPSELRAEAAAAPFATNRQRGDPGLLIYLSVAGCVGAVALAVIATSP